MSAILLSNTLLWYASAALIAPTQNPQRSSDPFAGAPKPVFSGPVRTGARPITPQIGAGRTAQNSPMSVPGAGVIEPTLFPAGTVIINEDLRFVGQDTVAGDNFGFDVWIDGDMLAIGVPFDNIINPDAGSAYLFGIGGNEIRKFTTPFGLGFFGDNYGTSITLRDGVLSVGAPREDAVTTLSGSIYRYQAITGQLTQRLTPTGNGGESPVGHSLGECVDASDTLLVSGTRADSFFAPGGGSVHVFNRATGQLIRKLFPNDPGFADNFGDSIAVSGELVVVGSTFDDVNAPDSGSAYVFNGVSGLQLHKLSPGDTGQDDLFGRFVAIEGNTVIVGAPFLNDASGNIDAGAAYVYDAVSGALIARLSSPTPGANFRFGDGLAISQDYILVGESLGLNTMDVRTGSIYVYDRQTLELLYKLEASDGLDGDALGEGIDLEGNRVVAGARGVDAFGNLAGAVYLFTLP